MNPIKWGKYPILYPSFKVCVIGDTKSGIIEFLKKIMPDKTKVIDTKYLDTLTEFKNHLSLTYPSYLSKNLSNTEGKSIFNYSEIKKEEKFIIYYTDKTPPKYILTQCNMIFFDGNTSTSLFKSYILSSFNQSAEDKVFPDLYLIIDKREKEHKLSYISKQSLQRYLST